MKRYVVFFLLAVFMLGSCRKKVEMDQTPNFVKTKKMLEPTGDNTIKGSALIRQQGGGVVHCGGQPIYLVPATSYWKQIVKKSYGSEEGGFSNRGFNVSYTPEAKKEMKKKVKELKKEEEISNKEDMLDYVLRKKKCGAQGEFEFDNVKDGEYYVRARITWTVDYATQGGEIIAYTSVSGGETKDIVVSP